MKRLLCIIDSLNVGGAETFLMKVMRCLSPEEYQFDFVVSRKGGAYEPEVIERGGRIYEVPPRRKHLFFALNEIRKIVKKNNYKYIFRLGDEPIVGVDLLAAKLGCADHLAFRSCNALTGLSFYSRAVNAVMRPILNSLATVKIAPSSLAAEFTFGKKCAKKARILNNGVDLNKFRYDDQARKEVRKEFGLQGKFVVGHIGRFNKQKNHRYLLEIFCEIRKQRNDAILFLIGTGDDQDKICQWICNLGLQNSVIMAGQRFDIPQILSAMDVFVFPSLHEGMPNTVIEAQATGLPCIIADTITREANITGLVQYLSLDTPASEWAKTAIHAATLPRKNTAEDFQTHGYDIECVAKEFVSLLGLSDDTSCESE